MFCLLEVTTSLHSTPNNEQKLEVWIFVSFPPAPTEILKLSLLYIVSAILMLFYFIVATAMNWVPSRITLTWKVTFHLLIDIVEKQKRPCQEVIRRELTIFFCTQQNTSSNERTLLDGKIGDLTEEKLLRKETDIPDGIWPVIWDFAGQAFFAQSIQSSCRPKLFMC